ncbi:histidine phosphatase family protein [Primorskyibacter sp. S187A]|uniref:histidine phosphatase family protein n=1 Tax=Primorskyibacter sp. S187A TaxID=3415130 RepID=UPI003C7C11C7
MAFLIVVSHPEVIVDAGLPIPEWDLRPEGRARAARFAESPVMADARQIWSSAERKALTTAKILAARQGLDVAVDPRLSENDRSATGFLPPPEFEAAADQFFARPTESLRGWETAVAAQSRIVSALHDILASHKSTGDLVLSTHGAVGTLLWCHLSDSPIDRCHDQPSQGHYWRADLETLRPESGWRKMA